MGNPEGMSDENNDHPLAERMSGDILSPYYLHAPTETVYFFIHACAGLSLPE